MQKKINKQDLPPTRYDLVYEKLKNFNFELTKQQHCNQVFSLQEISGVDRQINSVGFSLIGERSAVWTAVSWQGPMNSGRGNGEAEERS